MRSTIITVIEQITENRLTREEREKIADESIRIMMEFSKKVADVATESAREVLSESVSELKKV